MGGALPLVETAGAGRAGSALPGRAAGLVPVRNRSRQSGAMALLLEHEFKALPADKQIETLPFLEAVAHLPPFFGEPGPARCGDGSCGRAGPVPIPPPRPAEAFSTLSAFGSRRPG